MHARMHAWFTSSCPTCVWHDIKVNFVVDHIDWALVMTAMSLHLFLPFLPLHVTWLWSSHHHSLNYSKLLWLKTLLFVETGSISSCKRCPLASIASNVKCFYSILNSCWSADAVLVPRLLHRQHQGSKDRAAAGQRTFFVYLFVVERRSFRHSLHGLNRWCR